MGILSWLFRPPSEAQFAATLTKALRRAGDRRPIKYDAANRKLLYTDRDNGGEINLVNLYGNYSRLSKTDRTEWLQRTCIGLLNQVEPSSDFEHEKCDLRVGVRSRAMMDFLRVQIETTGASGAAAWAWTRVSDYLSASLIYDLPNAMRFVRNEDLETWGVTIYEAMEVARRNLDESPPTMYAALDKRLYIFQCGDAYDATRMLSLDLMRSLGVEGSPVAMPVTRDCLLVGGSQDAKALTLMTELAKEQIEAPRPVCAIPHLLSGDEWHPWSVSDDHPAAGAFRMLKLHHFGSEYAEQNPLLEALVESKGLDVFVAAFSAKEFGPKGEVRSFCVWTGGVPTWLPKTDLVCFFDDQRDVKMFVPWERVVPEVGSTMAPLDYWPPRWSVEDFPDDGCLKRMALYAQDP